MFSFEVSSLVNLQASFVNIGVIGNSAQRGDVFSVLTLPLSCRNGCLIFIANIPFLSGLLHGVSIPFMGCFITLALLFWIGGIPPVTEFSHSLRMRLVPLLSPLIEDGSILLSGSSLVGAGALVIILSPLLVVRSVISTRKLSLIFLGIILAPLAYSFNCSSAFFFWSHV